MNFRIHLEIFRICETQLWLFKVNVKVVEKATLPKTILFAFFLRWLHQKNYLKCDEKKCRP